ncbi:hypothetical protein PRZ48_003584 [Zasmidium cellare]|uniref:Sin3-associated polypeptide Sap18 n=1 Tax=Zasmidium cellare TaxID=395010 RepID=A0ABR0EVH5_ZASCE|nr:hypothetical protein PRZ48_003584 [Zasmidium cellare]
MALQPDSKTDIDRSVTSPFLLRVYWREGRLFDAWEFSIAPPADTTGIPDYSSLLPANIRQKSLQVYTWPNCTLGELTGLMSSVLPPGVLPNPAVGTRIQYKLIFPDTRATVAEGGRGKWIDKPLGSVVIGGSAAELEDGDMEGLKASLDGDAHKTLSDARFVIGDYVVCTIYPPGQDGRVAPLPPPGGSRGPPRDFGPPRGPPPRENGYGGGYGRGGGGYRGGYGSRGGGGFGMGPPPGEWRRGERPPGGDYGGGRGGYRAAQRLPKFRMNPDNPNNVPLGRGDY